MSTEIQAMNKDQDPGLMYNKVVSILGTKKKTLARCTIVYNKEQGNGSTLSQSALTLRDHLSSPRFQTGNALSFDFLEAVSKPEDV